MRCIRFFFFVSCLAFLVSPLAAHAQLDARCWTRDACAGARADAGFGLSTQEANEGFIVDTFTISICGKEKNIQGKVQDVGFCLPVGETTTKVGIGGKTEFSNLATYIQYLYRYGIMAAGILSVVMVIIGGLQWTMSGGNSGTIDAAKKRIAGAIVGLALAILSYTVLNQINPFLVNFRLPQIYMINQAAFPINTCDQVPQGTRIGYYRDQLDFEKERRSDAEKNTQFASTQFNILGSRGECGKVYFIDQSGGDVCHGVACLDASGNPSYENICVRTASNLPASCLRGKLGGTITAQGGFFEAGIQKVPVDDNLQLVALCGNGSTELAGDEIAARDYTSGLGQSYVFPRAPGASHCTDEGGTLGYYIVAEVNDEKGPFAGAIAVGVDDWHAIGRSDTHTCDINLSKWVGETLGLPVDCKSDADSTDCGCEGIVDALDDHPERIQQLGDELTKKLFNPRELHEGIICNISLTRDQFPDLGDNVSLLSCDS